LDGVPLDGVFVFEDADRFADVEGEDGNTSDFVNCGLENFSIST
jgi:hypothetical protein